MAESKALRRLVKIYPKDLPYVHESIDFPNLQSKIPINPIPAMIIFLLGMILGGHHQISVESTMMHKQVSSHPFPQSLKSVLTYLVWKPAHFCSCSTMLQLSPASHIPTDLDKSITAPVRARLLVLFDLWGLHAYGECRIIHLLTYPSQKYI